MDRNSKIVSMAVLTAAFSAFHGVGSGTAQEIFNLEPSEVVREVRGWVIGYSDHFGYGSSYRACLAKGRYSSGTIITIGKDSTGNWFLAVTNNKWNSIEVKSQYTIDYHIDHAKWTGESTGFESRDGKGLMAIGLKESFIKDFSQSRGMSMNYKGQQIDGFSLRGTAAAVAAVDECFDERVMRSDPFAKSDSDLFDGGHKKTDTVKNPMETEYIFSGRSILSKDGILLLTTGDVVEPSAISEMFSGYKTTINNESLGELSDLYIGDDNDDYLIGIFYNPEKKYKISRVESYSNILTDGRAKIGDRWETVQYNHEKKLEIRCDYGASLVCSSYNMENNIKYIINIEKYCQSIETDAYWQSFVDSQLQPNYSDIIDNKYVCGVIEGIRISNAAELEDSELKAGDFLYYGSRVGMEVTVTGVSGIDTANATIEFVHTDANARAYCEQYVQDYREECIKETKDRDNLISPIQGSCKTKIFSDAYGDEYYFEGRKREIDQSKYLYLIRDKGGKYDIVPNDYYRLLKLFSILCPSENIDIKAYF